ncbi:ECF transporter S component [Pseudoflavonifractor sp. An85]|uniref:ECF transporter S component n=1 Tax=Pseudoflavonifractor sp. An85 TaxID=1965661 RepID=UPI001FA85F1F|nr:ECF transporter S component [Pseudoflavonifractor sp. An85]
MWNNLTSLWSSVQENVAFLLVCLGVAVALFLVAMAVERLWLKTPRQRAARRAAYIGIFAAMAALLMYFEFPLPFAPSFYEIDLSEVPVLICSFSLGPVAGVVCELVKVILKLLLKGTTTAFVGDFANFVVGCSFILPATIVYHRVKTKKGAVAGMITGTVTMSIFGSFFNAVYLLPAFSALYGLPLDQLVAMGTAVNGMINSVSTLVFFAVVPFNIVKGAVVSLLTTLLYKRVERLLRMR